MKRILIGLAFGLVLAAQPYAGRPGYGPGYNSGPAYRGNNFAARIAQGERAGLITGREASRLWNMERDLRIATERAYRSGFGVNPRERDRLAQMSARLDYEITRQMRDGERYRRGPGRW